MLEQIIAALRARSDIAEWNVRQINTKGAQLYAVPNAVEAIREVTTERYVVDILCTTQTSDGTPTVGAGNTTLLPGDDITDALDAAVLMASLMHNPPYGFPDPTPLPDVPLVVPALADDTAKALATLHQRLRNAVDADPDVRLTAAEFFGELRTTRLCNSRGIDATQQITHLHSEWVLLRNDGEREVESFVELTRRRIADYPIEEEVTRRAQYAADTLAATPPPNYTGPVVMRGETISDFLNSHVLHVRSSGSAKYSKTSPWELGASVFRDEVQGDPLTVYVNRQLPFGNHAGRFDDEGLAAQRVLLIDNNILQTFVADQRYAEYLNIPPIGAFGDLELPPGPTQAADLLYEPYVEVLAFSWFNPDPITGDFASEIRLGYLVEDGTRIPFKGGTLVGNVLTALANVRWSAETTFLGDYQGPATARFGQLTIAGVQET